VLEARLGPGPDRIRLAHRDPGAVVGDGDLEATALHRCLDLNGGSVAGVFHCVLDRLLENDRQQAGVGPDLRVLDRAIDGPTPAPVPTGCTTQGAQGR
jgi:hypothetical protein